MQLLVNGSFFTELLQSRLTGKSHLPPFHVEDAATPLGFALPPVQFGDRPPPHA
jgi:hypothetical protein